MIQPALKWLHFAVDSGSSIILDPVPIESDSILQCND